VSRDDKPVRLTLTFNADGTLFLGCANLDGVQEFHPIEGALYEAIHAKVASIVDADRARKRKAAMKLVPGDVGAA
jgi:hypothetical protein